MSEDATPLVPTSRRSVGERVLLWCVAGAVRASLVVTPRPAALLVRRLSVASGVQTAQMLARHAPPSVIALTDERYGDEDDMVLDVARPAAAGGRFPLVLWVHGGGWVGGSKEELTGYFRLVASHGFAVAGPRYSLAPEHRYPTPLRQMMRALEYLQANADRYQIDPDRIAIGGDSAGAQIAAQIGALVTTPGYAGTVGVSPAITPTQLRGLVLACGPYDLRLLGPSEHRDRPPPGQGRPVGLLGYPSLPR